MEPLQGPCDPFEAFKNGLVHTCTVHLCIWLSYVIIFNEKGKKLIENGGGRWDIEAFKLHLL